ncbi:MAG: glutaredoxin [Tissierellia bacterium]|nr:glutaredoxin [Tissierellia bacterium]
MAKLKLYTSNNCPFCERVKGFIKENEIENVELVNISEDAEEREYLIEHGGMMQVPCLFVDDEPMYESADIIAYLKTVK